MQNDYSLSYTLSGRHGRVELCIEERKCYCCSEKDCRSNTQVEQRELRSWQGSGDGGSTDADSKMPDGCIMQYIMAVPFEIRHDQHIFHPIELHTVGTTA